MRVLFSGEVEVPDGTPEKDIEAWLKFEMGETCQLGGKNAMSHTDLMSAGCRNVLIDRTWPSAAKVGAGTTAPEGHNAKVS